MQHIKLDSSGGAFSISHNHASPRMVEQKQMKFRPKSAGDKLSQNHDDSDYDDFYDRSSSHVSPMTPVSGAWKADATPQAVVDSSTQTVETKGEYSELIKFNYFVPLPNTASLSHGQMPSFKLLSTVK